jgi:hypothetical protein
MKRFLSPDMDSHPEQVLEIFNQAGMVQQTPARFPSDQQVQIAILVSLATCHGAEHTQALCAALLGEPEYFLSPLGAQCVQRDHVFIVRQNLPARFGANRSGNLG